MLPAAHARFDVVQNLFGILGAGIVGRGDGDVGQADGDFAHGRPLAAVAIAAGAEHDDDASARWRDFANRLQRALERIRGVRIVAENHARIHGDALHPAGNLRRGRQSFGDLARWHLEPKRAGGDARRIGDVEATEQWQRNGIAPLLGDQREPSAPRIDVHVRRRHVGLGSQCRESDAACRLWQATPRGIIGVDDGKAGIGEIADELCLGGKIGFERLVIIEVIAGQVREDGGAKHESVDSTLIEAVGRDLHRDPTCTALD